MLGGGGGGTQFYSPWNWVGCASGDFQIVTMTIPLYILFSANMGEFATHQYTNIAKILPKIDDLQPIDKLWRICEFNSQENDECIKIADSPTYVIGIYQY